MSTTTALAILGDGYQIEITPEAEKQKATILTAARAVVAVTDPDSCDIAQSRLRSLASVRTAVESSRKQVKAPVIDLGKRIDGIAADFVADVVAEEARLSGLVTEYAREQQRIQREAARIERERQAAEKAAHEAEIARLKAEAAQSEEGQRAARVAQEKALAAQREAEARAEAARRQAEADAAAAREREEAARIAAAAVIAAPAPAGVREEIDFEVEDILAFVAKFPQLCRIEPKRADVLAALKKSFERNGKLPEVAGLRVFQHLKVKR